MAGIAECGTCGAPVPIVVLQPSRCRHCGGAPRLGPDVHHRLEALRHRIAQTARDTQQLDGKLAAFGQGVGPFEIGMGAMIWGFIGGFLTFGAAGNMPDHQGFFAALVDPPVAEPYSFEAATFWMAFVTVTGFSACCALAGLARIMARRQVRFTFPTPPTFPGGPPGCRVCGADLDSQGVVRRCRHCGADNVVDGVHFQQVTTDLGATLRAHEHAVRDTLAARQVMVARLERLVLGPPFAVLLLFPLVFWFGQPHPAWWLVPVGAFAVCILCFFVASMLPKPRASRR